MLYLGLGDLAPTRAPICLAGLIPKNCPHQNFLTTAYHVDHIWSNILSECFRGPLSSDRRLLFAPQRPHKYPRFHLQFAASVTMSDQIQEFIEIPKTFVKEGNQFINRCTKRMYTRRPSVPSPSLLAGTKIIVADGREFIQISKAVGVGFLVMGAVVGDLTLRRDSFAGVQICPWHPANVLTTGLSGEVDSYPRQ